jgi:cytochrome P450
MAAHLGHRIVDAMTSEITDIALPTIVCKDDPTPDEFHAALATAQRLGPIAFGAFGPEVLSYDLVRAVLRDSRFVIPQGIGLVVQGITSGPVWDRVTKLLLNLDGAQHQRLRRLVAKAFTPRAAERMRSACVDVITELVDRHIAAGNCDFVADIARSYPVPIICSLLGAPREDWSLFSDWVADLAKALSVNVAEHEPTILRAWEGLEGYVEELVAARRRSLTDDLISELIRAEDDGDQLTHDELVNLVVILFNAGTDTTRSQLATAVQGLADHPDQWELLAGRPELAPQAVEELMRHSPVNFRVLRKAVVDIELGGVHFPAGSLVIANTAAANRDPAVYDDPERLDITRHGAPAMLTFGGGVHYCLGAHLARIELAEALRVITAKMSNARRTGPAPWKPITELSGPTTLPIEFTGRVGS